MRIGARYGASLGLPHKQYVDNSVLLDIKQHIERTDRQFLDACSRRIRFPPVLDTRLGGRKKPELRGSRSLNANQIRRPLPSEHPPAVMAPASSPNMNAMVSNQSQEQGSYRRETSNYQPSLGPSKRQLGVSKPKIRNVAYRSTYEDGNRHLKFRHDLDTRRWSEQELRALHDAVDTYGDFKAWHRIASAVGTKSILECRHRWEKHGRDMRQAKASDVFVRRSSSSLV